jgi:hypothetical protein
MDPQITKAAIEVGTKVAESLVPSTVQKVLSWVSGGKSRKVKHRADWERRHGAKDRRISGIDVRFRKGFWFEYHRQSGAGKLDILNLTSQTREHLFQALVTEARRYEFSDRTSGATLEPSTIADSAIDIAWPTWKLQPREERHAVLLVEQIARSLLSKYNVRRIGRRQSQRRTSAIA